MIDKGKDLDLFIETRDFIKLETAMQKHFEIVNCFFNQQFKDGCVKRRYAAYTRGRFFLIDIGINGWYYRDVRVMTYEQMVECSINIDNLRILRPEIVQRLETLYKEIPPSPKFCISWFAKLVKRIFHNEGKIIAIVGPDGSGKTIVAEEVVKRLKVAFNASYRYMGWRNHSLMINAAYLIHKPRSGDKSWKKLPYYAEMMARYVTAWFKKKLLGRIIIMDRYFYDKLKPGFLIPKPDKLFLLSANPQNILARKNELSEEKIREIYESYNDIPKIIIDANKDVNYATNQIIENLAEELINSKVVLE